MNAGCPGGAAGADRWSVSAHDWSTTWDALAVPVYAAITSTVSLTPASRLLDVGCGAGGLVAVAAGHGVHAAGIDPAPGMVELARRRSPDCDIRVGGLPDLPWPDGEFDIVVSVNALLFAADTRVALGSLVRVCRPGGHVAIVVWADDAGNDLDTLERAAAAAGGPPFVDGGPLRRRGGMDDACRGAGLDDVRTQLVPTVWTAPGIDDLMRAVAPGDRPGERLRRAVSLAARPMHREGGYSLRNSLHLTVGRVPGPD